MRPLTPPSARRSWPSTNWATRCSSEAILATNRETAEAIFASYVGLRKTSDIVFLSYGALAEKIGRKGQGRLLAAPLDLVREICRAQELPDIATVIVSKESLLDGTLMPAPNAVEKYNGWVGLRKEQAKVLAFDWSSLR